MRTACLMYEVNMGQIKSSDIANYVEEHIGVFHKKRLLSLEKWVQFNSSIHPIRP